MPIKVTEDERIPNGYHQVAPVAVTVCPGNGRVVTIQADGGNIRYRPDNVSPTNLVVGGTEVGLLLADKECHTYIMGEGGKIQEILLLEGTNGSGAKVNVTTYK
jgi:hypothetical protein